jgi:hypothetical protein
MAESVEGGLFWTAKAERMTNSFGAVKGLNMPVASPVSFKANSYISSFSAESGYAKWATLGGDGSKMFARKNLQITYEFQQVLGEFKSVRIKPFHKI